MQSLLPVSAERALERLFSGVHDYVVQQRLPRCELLIADGADEELLSRVESAMLGEVAFPLETLPALLALESRRLLTLFLEISINTILDHQN
jgi:hypothetical protein